MRVSSPLPLILQRGEVDEVGLIETATNYRFTSPLEGEVDEVG
jgi:hypothetical protein